MKVFVARWAEDRYDPCYGVFSSIPAFIKHVKDVDRDWYDEGMEYYHDLVNAGQDPILDWEYIEDHFGIHLEEHEVL